MKIKIAENIKRFRAVRGFTQSDLATLLSVSTQAVSRWENDQAFPDITTLPLLAKYLDVSIDELMGFEGQQNKSLQKELRERKQAIIDDESEKIKNEIRILEIFEELGRSKLFYLLGYFERLMTIKNDNDLNIENLEERAQKARQMIRDRLRASSMHERMHVLSRIASFEDEEKLELWAEEYELPEYIKSDFWDELLLSRYQMKKNIDKLKAQNQKILFEHIKNTVYYLTYWVSRDLMEQYGFGNLERCRIALETLDLYSTRVDDIFIFTRILAEVSYADALLINGYAEESLDTFALASEHLAVLYRLPEGSELRGSVPALDTVQTAIGVADKFDKCVINIGGYHKPLFDEIRGDKRFTEFLDSLGKFFPRRNCRSWMNEKGNDALDAQWEMLLNCARQEVEKLSDGSVVVMLTSAGSVCSISFRNMSETIDAEGAMKFLLEKKKSGDAKIERLVCMWHDGGIDLPSFAFREALLTIESKNISTQMIMNGFDGYVVMTVKATMPKGYDA